MKFLASSVNQNKLIKCFYILKKIFKKWIEILNELDRNIYNHIVFICGKGSKEKKNQNQMLTTQQE